MNKKKESRKKQSQKRILNLARIVVGTAAITPHRTDEDEDTQNKDRVFKINVDGKTLLVKGDELYEIPQKNADIFFKNIGIEVCADLDSPQTRGKWDPFRNRYVGWCQYKDPNYPKTLIRGCPSCEKEFETEDRRKKYCSKKCRLKDLSVWRKRNRLLLRIAESSTRRCPICKIEYAPKTKKSPTCGKGKCRTAYSMIQNKEKN